MPQRWWSGEGVAERLVRDVVAHEWARLRPTAEPFSDRDLAHADSLEVVALASALSTTLQLHESGVEDYLLVRRTLTDWAEIARSGLEAYSSSLSFATSGSVDAPKRCPHALDTLWQEAELLATMFEGRTRVLSAVRSHHIYGFLFTVLLPQVLGIADVVDVRGKLPSSIHRMLRGGDLVIGYPDFWQSVLVTGGVFPSGVTGATSTAPCPDDLANGVVRMGCERLVQVYGSTETGGVGARKSADEPFQLFPFWERSGEALTLVHPDGVVGSSRVDLQACKLEYSIVSPK